MANNIEIKIKQVGQFENYYTEGILDLADDSTINSVIQLVDVREPDKRATDFVQTFTLPATKRNNQAFQHINQKGFQSYAYDPTQKLDCQVLVNGNQYFVGSMQVNQINRQDGYTTSYEVTIYAKLGSFFNDLGDKSIRDLVDVSDFNHLSNFWNIAQSWGPISANDPLVGAYKYPDVPPEPLKTMFYKPGVYYRGTVVPFQLGFGYVYPPVYTGQTDATTLKTQDFKPAFYVKTLFDRILESQGVRYSSDFIGSEYFRRLIIPSQSEIEGDNGSAQLTDQQIKDASAWVRYTKDGGKSISGTTGAETNTPGPYYKIASVGTSTGQSYGPFTVKFNNDSVAPATDTSNQYNPATGILQVKKSGRYNLTVQLRLTLSIRATGYGGSGGGLTMYFQGGRGIPVGVQIRSSNGNVLASNSFTFEIDEDAYQNGAPKGTFYITNVPVAVSLKNQIMAAGSSYYVTVTLQTTGSDYKYKTYDKSVAFWYIGNAGDYNGTMDLYVKGTEITGVDNPSEGSKMILALADTSVSDGDMVMMNDYLPNIKAIDFLKDINKMFNLYWKWDPKGFFIIEPRDKFYEAQGQYVIKDWTFKVDNNEEQSIQPLYDLSTKIFSFTYDTDDTYENGDYEGEYKEVYGSRKLEVESDFVDGETETALEFAATPMIDFLSTGLLMPSFTKYENNTRLYQKPGARIMFYGGFQGAYSWKLKNIFTNKTLSLTHFPYAGHLDNIVAPRWDLNWGVCKKYYYNWTTLTQNTLFNQFWGNYIDEVTDRNGHLLTVPLILSELDMMNLDIRDIIQVDEVHYRINKITHNPLNGKAVAELIKLKGLKVAQPTAGIVTSIAPGWTPDPQLPGIIPTPKPPIPTPVPPGPKPTPWVPVVPGGWPDPWTPDNITPIWITEGIDGEYPPTRRPWRNGTTYPGTQVRPWSWNITTSTGVTVTSGSTLPSPWREPWAETTPVAIWTPMDSGDINNNFSTQNSVRVMGTGNRVAPSARFVSVQGNNNTVADGASNIQVVGDNNIVAPNVSNVMIVGSNQFASKSDTSYINGVEQPVRTAGTRMLRSPSNSAGHNAKAIWGGRNSSDACVVLSAGQDTNSYEVPFIPKDDEIIMTPFGPKTA